MIYRRTKSIESWPERARQLSIGLLLFLSLSTAAFAAHVDGTWQTIQQMPDGNRTETIFVLKQEGSSLTGKVEVAWGDLPIQNGRIIGDRFSFSIPMGNKSWRYEGSLVDGKLHIILHDPNALPATLRASRIASDAENRPARLPLPALRSLPPNGLARTPPMGWNSWNHFQGHISDKIVREIVDAMVNSGMRDAGYVYINIDDTWEGERDKQGILHPNKKFPDMKALADYVHARGLKLGIYSSPGPKTCAGYAGSYGHEEQDAKTFAEWGIDYLKYDWCSAFRIYGDKDMRVVYQKRGEALRKAGRPIVYSFSQGGRNEVWTWGRLAGGNLWRTTDDIQDSFQSMTSNGFFEDDLAKWAGPGSWNDPDMLEVGNGGMTDEEYRTHMSLWAILAAPLIAGNDIRSMSDETREILINRDVIAVDQDPLGKQGQRVLTENQVEIWTKPLADGSIAIGIFNRAKEPAAATVKWKEIGLPHAAVMRDLWRHKDEKIQSSQHVFSIPAHGVVMLRVH